MITTRHGRRACYLHGCRQPECVAANYHYMARYRLDRQNGQQRRIDSTPAAEHARTLAEAGWSHRQIADAARCTRGVIDSLISRPNPTIAADLAHRILAAQPHLTTAAPCTYIDATSSSRRIRALVAIGYTMRAIAAATGMTTFAIGRITDQQRPAVLAEHAQVIAALYTRWSTLPGPSNRSRRRATRNGWAPPAAWDDIDDPDEQPDWTGHCGTNRGWSLHVAESIPPCARCEAAHTKQLGRRTAAAPESAAA